MKPIFDRHGSPGVNEAAAKRDELRRYAQRRVKRIERVFKYIGDARVRRVATVVDLFAEVSAELEAARAELRALESLP
jgi:hypothetical protein